MSPYMKMVALLTFGLLLVFGWHFSTVFGWFGSAPATQGEFFIRIGVILGGFFVVSAVTASRIASGDERAAFPDEREEKAELKSERVGLLVLYAGMLVVMWLAFSPLTPMQIANCLLAVVCLSELIKVSYGLLLLRKAL